MAAHEVRGRLCATTTRRGGSDVTKPDRSSLAAREMRGGPSGPDCRIRVQTTVSCSGTMARVVSVTEKAGITRQVCAGKTNASEVESVGTSPKPGSSCWPGCAPWANFAPLAKPLFSRARRGSWEFSSGVKGIVRFSVKLVLSGLAPIAVFRKQYYVSAGAGAGK